MLERIAAGVVAILIIATAIVAFRVTTKFLKIANLSIATREGRIARLRRSKARISLHQFAVLKDEEEGLKVERKVINSLL